MARVRQNPSTPRPNLGDMTAAGLGSLAGFLLHQLPDDQAATDWLRNRFPGARLNTIRDALNWLRRSESAAATLQAGQRLPSLNEIPVDPTIPTNRTYRYVLRVTFHEPNPAMAGRPGFDRTFERYVVYHSNNLLTPAELQSQVPSDVRERIQRAEVQRRRGYVAPEGFGTFRGTVDVQQLTRRRD